MRYEAPPLAQDTKVIQTSGALTPSFEIFGREVGPAVWHFSEHRSALEGIGMNVARLIVPRNLSLGNVNDTYKNIRDRVDETVDKLPDQDILLLAHSMGGIFNNRYLQEHFDGRMMLGAITLGSPHALNGAGSVLEHPSAPLGTLITELRDFLEETNDMAAANQKKSLGIGPQLHIVGSMHDETVHYSNAVADIPGATRYLFTSEGVPEELGEDVIAIEVPSKGVKIRHFGYIAMPFTHPLVLDSVTMIAQRIYGDRPHELPAEQRFGHIALTP